MRRRHSLSLREPLSVDLLISRLQRIVAKVENHVGEYTDFADLPWNQVASSIREPNYDKGVVASRFR